MNEKIIEKRDGLSIRVKREYSPIEDKTHTRIDKWFGRFIPWLDHRNLQPFQRRFNPARLPA